MAIKFYRAKALPSSLNSSHDGVWFIKPDGATSFRTYNVKDGVAVGDGFEDLGIGGRNLAIEADILEWADKGTDIYGTYYRYRSNTLGGGGNILPSTVYGEGQYTISFRAIMETGTGARIAVYYTDASFDYLYYSDTLESYEFTTPKGKTVNYIGHTYSTNGWNRLYDLKVEKGNKATDWTPAPEDKEDAFSKNTAFNKNFGTIAGTVTEGDDSRLSNSREWIASTVSQSEAQAGTSTTRRAWTALRVRQAISGWWATIVDTIAEKVWVSANFDKYGFWNLKTNGVQHETILSQNDVDFVAGENIAIKYGGGGQVIFDAENTQYNSMSLPQLQAGTDTQQRVVSAKVLNDWADSKLAATQYNSMSLPQLQAGTDTQQRVVSAKVLNDWFESQFAPRVIVDEHYPAPFIHHQGTQWGDASEPVWIAGHYLKKGSTIKIEHLSHPADANFMHQFTLGIAIDDDVQFAITDPLMRINPDDIFTTTYIEMYFVEDNEFVVRTVKYIKSNNFREITGGDILTVVSNQSVPIPEDGFELKIKSRGAHSNYILLSLSCRVTFEPTYVKV